MPKILPGSGNSLASGGTITGNLAITGTLDVTGVATFTTTVTGSGNIMAGAAFALGFTGRGQWKSSADGVLKAFAADGTTGAQVCVGSGSDTAPGLSFTAQLTAGFRAIATSPLTLGLVMNSSNTTYHAWVGSTGYGVGSAQSIFWASATHTPSAANADLLLARSAAGVLGVSGATGSKLLIGCAMVLQSAVSGASVTCTGLIPAKCKLIGVSTKVTTALGTGNGTTGYAVGTVADPNQWGDIVGTATTTTSCNADATADPTLAWNASAQDVVLTAAGGNFDGTGAIRVVAHYLYNSVPTS